MEPTNPYQAPETPVTRTDTTAAAVVRPARRVRAARGGAWINYGFVAVTQGMVGWLLLVLALGILYTGIALLGTVLAQLHFALSYVPSFLLYPLMTVLWGGVMLACHDGPLTFRKVVDGATQNMAPLALLGVLSAVISFAAMIPFVVAVLPGSPPTSAWGGGGQGLRIALVFLGVLLTFSLISAALWFAPALVAVGHVRPWQAITRSFRACFKNILPFTVFMLMMIVLAVAAMLLVALIFAIVAGVLGFATSFEGLDSAAGISGIVFGALFYMAAVVLFMSVTAAAQYASFKDVFAYGESP